MWEFPGGKLRNGENPEDTLKREFLEEFGLTIDVGSFILDAPFENEGTRYLMKVYEVRIVSGEPVLREHDAIRWVTADEMRALPCGYSDAVIVERLLSGGIRSPFQA
jgi:8-oxo-dGTP diphosphatase